MDITDDASNGGRVTRARRKRLVSIESETSSRPGTPISPPRTLKGNSKVETETLPKRVTRRNSVTNTPQKTPSKAKEIDGTEMGTPLARTRRRSLSISEDNTPQKLIKSHKHLSVLSEEDVKDKTTDEKTPKRTAEKLNKRTKLKSPLKNTGKLVVRKTATQSKKVLQMQLDSDSDIEVINLADTSYESSDAFDKITKKPGIKIEIANEDAAALKLPNAENPIIGNPIPQSQDVFETTINPIDLYAGVENHRISLNHVEKSVVMTPNTSTVVSAEQSKSVTFENEENLVESKTYPKTPVLHKKGTSPLLSVSNIDKNRSMTLTDSLMQMENENSDYNDENKNKTSENQAKIKSQLQQIDSRCLTPNITPQTDSMLSSTTTPEKILRSGKAYGESPTSELNKSNEINTDNQHQNKSPNKEFELRYASIEFDSEHASTNKSFEKLDLQNHLNNSSLINSVKQDTVKTASEKKSTECEKLGTLKKDQEQHQKENITSTHSSCSPNKNLSRRLVSTEKSHVEILSPTKNETAFSTQSPTFNFLQKYVQNSEQSSSPAKRSTSGLNLTPKSNHTVNKDLNTNSSGTKKQTNSNNSLKQSPFNISESPKRKSIHKGQEDNLINTYLSSPCKLSTLEVKNMRRSFERESLSIPHLSSPVSKPISDKTEAHHSDIPEKDNISETEPQKNSFKQVYEMQIVDDSEGNNKNKNSSPQNVSKDRENSAQNNLQDHENENNITYTSNPVEIENQNSTGKQFSKSWSQSVKKLSNKIDFIEKLPIEKSPQVINETNLIEENKKTARKSASKILDDSSDEDEIEDVEDSNNIENENLRSFFEGEAMSMGKNYESGDSMDEEERELNAENNLESDKGESIGSQDTSEDDRYDDSADEKDSFIVPSDEEEEDEEALVLHDSDNSEHINNESDSSEKEKPKRKGFKRVRKISTDSEDETALKLEVTHMIDETIADQHEVRILSSDEEQQEDADKHENALKQQESEEISQKTKQNSLIETEVQNPIEVNEETQKKELFIKTRRSKRHSLMELGNQVRFEDQNAEIRDNLTLPNYRPSQNMDLTTKNNEFCYNENHTYKDAGENGSFTKHHRSQKISLMEENGINVEEQNVEHPKKKTPVKQRRSKNISLLESHEHNFVEEEITEINAKKCLQNISLVGNSKMVIGEDLKEPLNETSAKQRRSRNKSLAEQTEENDLLSIAINVKEKNFVDEERNDIESRSYNDSLLNKNNAFGVENHKKNSHGKHSRKVDVFDNNHVPEAQSNMTDNSQNNFLVKENMVDLIQNEEPATKRSSRIALQMHSDQKAVEEEKSIELLSVEKSFSRRSRKMSSNSIVEENNIDGDPKTTSKILDHAQNHVEVNDYLKDDFEFNASNVKNLSRQLKDSDIKSSEFDNDYNKVKNLNESNESVAKIKQKRSTMKTQLSKSFNETIKEQNLEKSEKKRRLSVSFVAQKCDHNEIDAAEAGNESEITHSTKKIKLSFEETSNVETLKIQGRNTSTPFVSKNVNISCNNQTDISNVIARCNQMLEEAEKTKKLSKENKFAKQKKKKLKPKVTANQVIEDSVPSMKEKMMKRAALKQAVQASQNLLTKPSNKRQRGELGLRDDENKYESKRLPADILAALSSSDGDSPNMPKKRKKSTFFEEQRIRRNVFKSISGDIIVESPISMPPPKKRKQVEVIKTSSGRVIVETITPLRKKINDAGFRESPITPVPTGWKMRQLLLKSTNAQSPILPAVEKKRKRLFANAIVEPTHSLPQPSWTKTAGTFKIGKVPQQEQIPIIRNTGAIQFGVVALDDYGKPDFSKRVHMQVSGAPIGLSAAERALNFRESTIYRKDTPREETHQLLRRKKVLH